MIGCHINQTYHAGIPDVPHWFQPEISIVKSTKHSTRRKTGVQLSGGMTITGVSSAGYILRLIHFVWSASGREDTSRPRMWIIYSHFGSGLI